ncbi:MAG: hypothetical protein Q8S84_00825 [bacterium]|nr:hypothetical protein [bacterium]
MLVIFSINIHSNNFNHNIILLVSPLDAKCDKCIQSTSISKSSTCGHIGVLHIIISLSIFFSKYSFISLLTLSSVTFVLYFNSILSIFQEKNSFVESIVDFKKLIILNLYLYILVASIINFSFQKFISCLEDFHSQIFFRVLFLCFIIFL